MGRPHQLRVEHLDDAALGIAERRPRLSWRLPDGVTRQHAYAVEVDGQGLGRIESALSVLVPWPGAALRLRQRVTWRVKVWTDAGESEWSEPAWFETGLVDPEDWVATWIEPHEPDRAPAGQRPPHVLRRRFHLDEVAPAARLYATAHGIYECFLNGTRVGDLELTPGFTSYGRRLHVQTYDVGDLLVAGDNEWQVVLSDGWYRGRCGFIELADNFGETLAFLGQLHVGDVVVPTDTTWQSATGPIRAADLMDGQSEDHRVEPTDWAPVTVVGHDLGRLTSSPAPPVRRVEELRPVAVTRLSLDRQLVDLGQNVNGWVRLGDLGPAGTALTLVHGEALDADGDVTLAHLGGDHPLTNEPFHVAQTDRVASAGRRGEVFEPRHTTHGFQYVRVEGHPHPLTPDDVTGVVVHTDLRRTGWFRCSDDRLNRLHEIATWTFRANACDIPTDCPQRERAGWSGDWQVFIPSAAFIYDVAGFSLKWLRDLAAEQLDDGRVLNIAPDPIVPRAQTSGTSRWSDMQGSAGWGDAVVLVPWEMWRAYGDREVLAELWPAMVRWLDFAADAARTRRHPSRREARPEPAPHERYLWDGGFHWGEWLEPGATPGAHLVNDQGHVATAFLRHSSRLAARIGRLLGSEDQAARFDELSERAREAWCAEYLDADGTLSPDTQANHVRALAFDLIPGELRLHTASRLVELIRQADTHLGTGFLATPYLLPVLADTGHLDVAYELLMQDTPPSWLTMIERGATSVWESWEGIGADGTPKDSLSHYSKGAVIQFLHTHVAGIRILDDQPGYRRFRVAPRPGGTLTWAQAVHDSPYGRVESSWRIDHDGFHLTVTVPPGTTAEVALPDGTVREQPPGTATHRQGCYAPG